MSEKITAIPQMEMIQDAMRQAILKQIFTGAMFHRDRKKWTASQLHTSDLKKFIITSTEKNCTFGSREVLLYLAIKYPQQFLKLFLFRTRCQSFLSPGWNQHTYFIAQDMNGCWYSGSPANLNGNDDFGEYYHAENIELLLSKMKNNPSRMKFPRRDDFSFRLESSTNFLLTPVFTHQANQSVVRVGLLEYKKGKVFADSQEWQPRLYANFLPLYLRGEV